MYEGVEIHLEDQHRRMLFETARWISRPMNVAAFDSIEFSKRVVCNHGGRRFVLRNDPLGLQRDLYLGGGLALGCFGAATTASKPAISLHIASEAVVSLDRLVSAGFGPGHAPSITRSIWLYWETLRHVAGERGGGWKVGYLDGAGPFIEEDCSINEPIPRAPALVGEMEVYKRALFQAAPLSPEEHQKMILFFSCVGIDVADKIRSAERISDADEGLFDQIHYLGKTLAWTSAESEEVYPPSTAALGRGGRNAQ